MTSQKPVYHIDWSASLPCILSMQVRMWGEDRGHWGKGKGRGKGRSVVGVEGS